MEFLGQPRLEPPHDAQTALSQFLHLSTDSTGRYRQNEMLKTSLLGAIDYVEGQTDRVLLKREWIGNGDLNGPLILPFDVQTPLLRFDIHSPDGEVAGHVEKVRGRYWLYAEPGFVQNARVSLEVGHLSWGELEASLRLAVLKVAARFYGEREGEVSGLAEVDKLLAPYRPMRVGGTS